MRRRALPRLLTGLFAGIAGAQTAVTPPLPTESTVARLTNAPSEKGMKEVATLLRAVTDSPYLSWNIAQSTIAITGTPEQLALAEWLSKAIDKPAGWRPSDSEYGNATAREFKLPSVPDELVRHRLALRNTGDLADHVVHRFQVLDVQGADDIDARGQHLLDVFPPLGVPA